MNTKNPEQFIAEVFLSDHLFEKVASRDADFATSFREYAIRSQFFTKISQSFAYQIGIPFDIAFAIQAIKNAAQKQSILTDFGTREDSSGLLRLAIEVCSDLKRNSDNKLKKVPSDKAQIKRREIFEALRDVYIEKNCYVVAPSSLLSKIYLSHSQLLIDAFDVDFTGHTELIWSTHEKLLEEAFSYIPSASSHISLKDPHVTLQNVPGKVIQRYSSGMTQLIPSIQEQLARMSEALEALNDLKQTCIDEDEANSAEADYQLFEKKISSFSRVISEIDNAHNNMSIGILDISPDGFYDHPFPLLALRET